MPGRGRASRAFEEEQWSEAAQLYQQIVQWESHDVRHWARLGYSYLMMGEEDRAIMALMRVCQFSRGRAWGLYYLARAYARKGETSLALEFLRAAVAAGLMTRNPLSSVSEFAPLRADPEFRRLELAATPLSRRPPEHQFDFYLGTWNATNSRGKHLGKLQVTRGARPGELVSRVVWEDGQECVSHHRFDIIERRWESCIPDPDRTPACWYGNFQADAMVLYKDGENQERMRYVPETENRVRVFCEGSRDGGRTWEVKWQVTLRRE